MEQIGWALVDAGGAEVQHWGDTPGVIAGLPDMIRLPNGDDVHCPQAGQIQDWQLVPRMWAYGQSVAAPSYDGTNVVVTDALSNLKSKLRAKVDDDAETVRLRYITPGAGMAMTYQEKKDQAVAVIAMGETAANALLNHGAAEFPTLSASVPVEAQTLFAAAQLVMSQYEAWAALSRAIESARLTGKKAIGDASDAASAQAAYEAITWPNA